MIVCHCHAVSDREIRSAIDQGVRDLDELGDACQAGTRCGGCRPGICELLDQPEQVLALPVAS
jgi:bacterioferritin-associated ferredoxin